MADLREFLNRYAEREFEWGQDDCSLIIADWWRENHGQDPAAHLRGTYADERSCHQVVRRAFGLARLVSGICAAAGARVTRNLKDGDFAVLNVGGSRICGIRCGRYWAIRNKGVGFIPEAHARVVKAWAI